MSGWMRSPTERRDSGNTDDVGPTVQDTLDAFKPIVVDEEATGPSDDEGTEQGPSTYHHLPLETHQESIDTFSDTMETSPSPSPPPSARRAMEGLALEMSMERVALSEAASGVSRDELLITIAREVEVPLERLDLVDGYLTDLELEGRVRLVGDSVVLCRPDDGDLLAMGLTEQEFLNRYRRRYLVPGGGEGE